MEIIPSILSNNPEEVYELMSRCEGIVDRISIDIIDGVFANNKTVEPTFLEDIETKLKIDYQLMVNEPVNWVEKCVRGQADRIIGHVEKMSNQFEFVGKVQEVGLEVGMGLDLSTPVEEINERIINNLDVVLVMSVPAGFGGQEFDARVLAKLDKLNQIRNKDKNPFRIQDDGGITLDKIDDVRLSGADEVSIGRRLFDGDLRDNINKFKKAAYKKTLV